MGVVTFSACVTPPLEPRKVLDERSGISLTVVDQPLVLARERRDVAVQARDYLTLVAAQINESGKRELVWVVHQWSTIDSRADSRRIAASFPESRLTLPFTLWTDGRPALQRFLAEVRR
jgi:hypothetical protein